jgi:hypothetical protein
MLPRYLKVPGDQPLELVHVAEGLYTIKGAYAKKQDYFQTSGRPVKNRTASSESAQTPPTPMASKSAVPGDCED